MSSPPLPPPILALWSLANSWMFVWGLAATIPILIHLLSRRTRNTTNWAAMEFLRAAVRKNARRLRLEQWLLLALRTLAMLLIALAWAEPSVSWLPSASPAQRAAGQTHTILVLDGSYSMLCSTMGQRLWETAQQRARQLVTQSVPGDGFSLILMAEPPQAIIADVAFDRDDVQQEISSLAPTHGGAPLAAALAEVERVVRMADARHPRLVHHRVLFFTDLGETTWEAAMSSECRRLARELANRAAIMLVNVTDREEANLAVTRLTANRAWPVVSDRVTFEVQLESFCAKETTETRVELLVDGDRVAEQKVAVPAAGQITLTFPDTWNAAGEHVVTARIAADALGLDNTRFLSIPIRDMVHVLCVEGEQDAAKYVALALAPNHDNRGPIRVETAAESALLERNLLDFDCVWLCNVGRFGREETNLLYRYVMGGGAVITALGDQTQPDNYHQELGGAASGKRLLPARVGQLTAGGPFHFDPADYAHPILEPFRGRQRAGLLTAPIWRYLQLTPYDPAAKIVLRFNSGDPAIVEESVGRGVSLLIATSVSLTSTDVTRQPPIVWTALPTWPSFPPLVHRLTQFAVRGRQQGRNVVVGEPLVATVPLDTQEVAVAVTTPEDHTELVPLRPGESEQTWEFAGTNASGVYRAQYGNDRNRLRLFAVNLDTRESDLSQLDQSLLPDPWRDLQTNDGNVQGSPATRDHWPLFRLVLAAVLFLLVSETVLAWRLGGAPG